MGNFKVIGKSYSGNPITDVVVPVRKQGVLPIVPRKQYLDETIVTSTVDKDGTNEQVFMNSNGNRSYGLDINGTDSLAKRFYPDGMFREYKTFKPGTPEFEEIAKKSKKYEVPLVGYEEASNNLEEVKDQMEKLQMGGITPSSEWLENLPYGRSRVNEHNKLVEMGKRFGNVIPGLNKPVPLPNKYQPTVPPVKMPMHEQDSTDAKPVPMPTYPGWSKDKMPKQIYQEGGEVPSNDQQQQLFVSIITDMANVLGVEPSQELAEAVMTAFENNDDSQGLITLFTQIKDKRMSETGLFREGGKMNAFVNKFKCGGKAKKKTSKKQEGGEVELTTNYDYTNGPDLTRRQARKIAEVNKGADRADFRKGMQNARRHFDDRGLRGADKRNAARRLVAGLETANRTFTPPVAPVPELNVQLPVIETPAELQLKAREVVEPTPVPVTPNTPTAPTKPTTPTKPVVSTPVTITGSPTVGGNYYDPNTNPWYRLGAKWGERARARREERRKNGERSFLQQLWDPHPEPLPTHDRKAAASGMVDDFLNTHSPRAKARK